jgi:hypothetical protein
MEKLSIHQIHYLSRSIVAAKAPEEITALLDKLEAGQRDYDEILLRLRQLSSRSRVSEE